MYNIDHLYKKINQFYQKGVVFISYIENSTLFPLKIPLQGVKEAQIQKNYQDILQGVKKLEKSGLHLEYRQFTFNSLGKQTLPIGVIFLNLESYLNAISKKSEYTQFTTLYEYITTKYPTLKTLFLKKPFTILEYKNVWHQLLAVVDFLHQHSKPNIYIRELSIENIDTKFVEKYKKIIDILLSNINENQTLQSLANYTFEKKYHLAYPEPTIRFRILDENLYIQTLSDITLLKSEFERLQIACQNVFIVENKITTLSFPNIKNSIVIFGQGYGISVLKDISWLKHKHIYYSGDIDFDGYAILSQLRKYFSQTQSFLMDEHTLNQCLDFVVSYKISKKPSCALLHLLEHESRVYKKLLEKTNEQNSIRLEQERIPYLLFKRALLQY